RIEIPAPEDPEKLQPYWVPAERLSAVRAAYPNGVERERYQIPEGLDKAWDQLAARLAIIRGLIEICGPIRGSELAKRLAITVPQAEASLEALEGEGIVLRGRFTRESKPQQDWKQDETEVTEAEKREKPELEWCHRRLLARIHRLTMDGLRQQIQPVDIGVYQQFLFQHHGLHHLCHKTGENGLFEVITQLQGLDLPAMAWESDLIAPRMDAYSARMLDELCLEGTVTWGRMFPPKRDPERSRPMASLTRVVPISLFVRNDLAWLSAKSPLPDTTGLGSRSQEVLDYLQHRGASFADDLAAQLQLLPIQLEESLGELISYGFVNADGFGGFRQLLEQR
ncbi:MAG: DEAD/DEAH box helicase, partial [Planctomycetaceae bacterium]|nr:DEAD/DEAH box helicase [Planctomycetaceae bacterium]